LRALALAGVDLESALEFCDGLVELARLRQTDTEPLAEFRRPGPETHGFAALCDRRLELAGRRRRC